MKALLWIFLLSFSCLKSYAQISVGANSFVFSDKDRDIKVWYYSPSNVINKNIPIVFVMHGIKRDAKNYRDDWIQYAKEKNFLLVVPEFSTGDFRGEKYNTGNMMEDNGRMNTKENWSFSIIEKIFRKIKSEESLETEKYYLYGHSAGAQFVHRFVQFFPEASLELAIAANAGWYTFLDQNVAFPYGIKDLNINEKELNTIFSKKLIVLLGDEDNNAFDKSLRNTFQAKDQGRHRFERGNNYFNFSKKLATNIEATFNWEMVYVEGASHHNSDMAEKAYEYIK